MHIKHNTNTSACSFHTEALQTLKGLPNMVLIPGIVKFRLTEYDKAVEPIIIKYLLLRSGGS